MRQLTELEILRAEVELLRRLLGLADERAQLLLEAWRDEVRRNDKDI